MNASIPPDGEPESPATWTCRIRPFGVDIAIGCPASLLPDVEKQLSPWNHETAFGASEAHVSIAGSRDGGVDAAYALHEGNAVIMRSASPDDILVGLQRWLDTEITRRVTHLTSVHAGVVSWRGRAILLPGPSGAGKTALVSALVDRGATYYSDELAFVDARGWVHAYPRHLVVRDARGVSRSAPVARAAHTPTDEIPVGLMLALRFAANERFEVVRLASSEALLVLLANTAHRLSSVRSVPAGFLQVAALAATYRGTRGESSEASDAILQLADRTCP